jgi:Flp pilus assembly protein TadG
VDAPRLSGSVRCAGTRLRSEERGQIAVLMALFMALVLIVGACAIDVGLVYLSFARFRNAMDAAALAGVNERQLNPASGTAGAEAVVRDVLQRHGYVDDTMVDIAVAFSMGASGETLTITAAERRDTFFLRFFGVPQVSFGAATGAGVGGSIDVVLAVDVTNSMEDVKNELKAATAAFVNQVNPSVTDPNGPKMAYVVFAGRMSGSAPAGGVVSQVGVSSASAADASALTLAVPLGVVSGNLLLAQIGFEKGSDIVITPPVGWTLVRRTNNGADVGVAVYRRFAGAAEPADYGWNFNIQTQSAGAILAYSGVHATNALDGEAGQATSNGAGHATPSITTTHASSQVVTTHVIKRATTWTAPAGMTESFDVASTGNVTLTASYEPQANPGATGARTAVAGDPEVGVAQILALRPVDEFLDPSPNLRDAQVAAHLTNNKSVLTKIADNTGPGPCPNVWPVPQPVFATRSAVPLPTNRVCATRPSGGSGTYVGNGFEMAVEPTYAWSLFSTANGGRTGVKKALVVMSDGANNFSGISEAEADAATVAAAQAAKRGTDSIAGTADDVEIFTVGLYGSGESNFTTNPPKCPAAAIPAGATTIDTMMISSSSSTPGSCDHYYPLNKAQALQLPQLMITIANSISRSRLTE